MKIISDEDEPGIPIPCKVIPAKCCEIRNMVPYETYKAVRVADQNQMEGEAR